MRRLARKTPVLLGLFASVALAGCGSTERLGEASAESFSAEPEPRPAQSIPPKTKLSGKATKLAHKPQRLRHATAIKPQSLDPVTPAEPRPAEPTPARSQADNLVAGSSSCGELLALSGRPGNHSPR